MGSDLVSTPIYLSAEEEENVDFSSKYSDGQFWKINFERNLITSRR
jgi:hypothetical protein